MEKHLWHMCTVSMWLAQWHRYALHTLVTAFKWKSSIRNQGPLGRASRGLWLIQMCPAWRRRLESSPACRRGPSQCGHPERPAQPSQDPRFLSITVNNANCGPLHHLIYYFNDYIPHCLAIVSLIDLIKFGLIMTGDI